ncbi:hypothetical protein EAH75_01510 [Rhodanobacter glycinis]|nr:hypothetical protein EAH75_01510 [Rhodanobacter glycinis]
MVNADIIVPARDYGFDNTGATDNSAKLAIMLADIQTNVNGRGRRIRLGAGTYKFNTTWAFSSYAAGLVHNIILEGDSPASTILDFSGCPAGTDGLTFNLGTHFIVKNLSIASAPRDGLVIGLGNSGSNYCNLFLVDNVIVQSSGRDGLVLVNAYLGTIRDCLSRNSGGVGFNFKGFSTSLHVSRCDAQTNTGAGWSLNAIIYSEFSACGADSNGQQGWAMSNMQSVQFTACGAESNQKDAFQLTTSDASAVGLPTQAQDIHGVVFSGCYGLSNSAASAGTYASFITAATSNSRPIDFKILGGNAYGGTVSDRALILAGSSGQVTCHKDMFNDAGCTAADSVTGTVEVANATVSGRRAITYMSSSQSLTNNTMTLQVWNAAFNTNDLGATLASNAIVVPRGVNKVRVSVSLDFAANATGVRQLFVMKNGSTPYGVPTAQMNASSGGDTTLTGSSTAISVVAGDTFSVQAYQNSGGALNLTAGAATWLAVEAIN